MADTAPSIKNKSMEFIEGVKNKGYSKKAAEDILEILDGADDKIKNTLMTSLKILNMQDRTNFTFKTEFVLLQLLPLRPFCAL